MEIAAIRELLAERLWVVLEAEQNRGWGDNGIIRYIEGVNREDLDALVLYLQEYTSADNNTPSDTVTNPMAGTQWARTGVWNGGRIWYEEVKNTHLERFFAALDGFLCPFVHSRRKPARCAD